MFSIRTAGEPAALKDSVRKALGLLAPDIALSAFATVKDVVAGTVSYFSFLRRVLIQISATGLLLAVIGIYGVVANLASERTKEIGIRMALGAEPRSIIWLFLKNGMILAVTGAAIGAAASWFLVKLLKQMLPAIPELNPWVVAAVSVLFVLIAVIASWLPANRATRINPVIALRSE
jgi:putative ABC transport system permease protein